MARSSPGVQRVVAILNFIADHPEQAFTLTDIVRALKLSRATCHALLTGLVEANYLYRTSDKSYVLGPALAAIGAVANTHYSPLQAAKPEMRALADEFDTIVLAAFKEGNEVVMRERAASRSHLGASMPRGTRLPLRPPFGSIFMAWSSREEVEAWLDQVIPAPAPLYREQMYAGIEFARSHGFQVTVRNETEPAAGTLDWLFSASPGYQPVALLTDWDPQQQYHLSAISAPVLDAQRRVAFVLLLQGFRITARQEEIFAIGERLKQAAARVSMFIGARAVPDVHEFAA